jgi:hypothetical protein
MNFFSKNAKIKITSVVKTRPRMPNPSHPGSVGRIIAFVLVGAVGGFYVQGELERGYKEKQLRAYEDYLERTSKTKKK